MFRRLSETVRKDTEHFLDGNKDAADYANLLSYRGNALIGNLHGHHGWEDHSYFPELAAADPRFDAGLEILEKDHKSLDLVLESFTDSAHNFRFTVYADEEWGELYDLENGPNETHNLWDSPDYADKKADLSLRFNAHLIAQMDESPRAKRMT